MGCRDVTRIPTSILNEQVLPIFQAKQCNGDEPAVLIFAEEDRIFALHLFEFGRDNERLVYIVQFGRRSERYTQRAMLDIVQRYPVRHVPPFPNA